MRKRIITFIILLLALTLLVVGITENQPALIASFYKQMAEVP